MLKKIGIPIFLFSTLINFEILKADSKDNISVTELVQRSIYTFQNLKVNKDIKNFEAYFKNSKAILIFPELYEGSLIFGAKAGNGILMIRNESSWSGPFFYSLGGVSVGLQFGVKVGKVVFTIMTDRGLKSLLKENIKIGVDLNAAIAHKGIGYSAESTLRLADIYSFSENKGLFLGGSFDGSFIQQRNDFNSVYHGKKFTIDEILSDKEINLKQNKLIEILNR